MNGNGAITKSVPPEERDELKSGPVTWLRTGGQDSGRTNGDQSYHRTRQPWRENTGVSSRDETEFIRRVVSSRIHSTTEQTVQSDDGVPVPVPQEASLMTIRHRCAAPAGLQVAHTHWKTKQNRTSNAGSADP